MNGVVKVLKMNEYVEMCEHYDQRFSVTELAIMYEISEYQVKAILKRFKVKMRKGDYL